MTINIRQIENNVKDAVEKSDETNFIYDFLLAYGLPKATIKRQQLATQAQFTLFEADDVAFKKKVYFRVDKENELPLLITELANENGPAIKSTHPRFVIATDFKRFMAIDTKTKDSLDTPFAELPTHYAFFLPWAGMEKSAVQVENPADVKAAERMAKLFDEIKHDNPNFTKEYVHGLNVFLTRLLFCFFAEDTEIFPKGAFTQAIDSYTQIDGSDLGDFLTRLFAVLNTPEKLRKKDLPDYLQQFPYVNGGLFRDAMPLPNFSARSRRAIIKSGELDWAAINPDIFGSMIQNVVTEEDRGDFGIHYTSVPNIMKVIQPLFLDELHKEFSEACILRTDVKNPKKIKRDRLNALLGRIANIRIFDPACGSGNFLIIAYRELRKLEIAILKELQMLTFSSIQLRNFYGIEISDFACEVAKLSLWLAEHQMNMIFKETFGQCNPTLPLKEAGQIVCGNSTRLDWSAVCPKNGQETYVLGNPPYQGSNKQSPDQKADMKYVLGTIQGYKNLDYIACWFSLAEKYIRRSKNSFAFVSTNSLCQGEQVAILWPLLLEHSYITFAIQSFKWKNNAKGNAGVTCVIVGMKFGRSKDCLIYDEQRIRKVEYINPYLLPDRRLIITKRSVPLSAIPPMLYGSKATDGGFLSLSSDEKNHLFNLYPDLRCSIVKKFIGSDEAINGKERFCLWITDSDVDYIKNFPEIVKRIEFCRQFRLKSKKAATRQLSQTPYAFGENRYREAEVLLVPATSSESRQYIPIGYYDEETVVSNAAQTVCNAPLWLFSVVTSRMHMTWIRCVCGALETRIRYSGELGYNTFPFPSISKRQRDELSELAQQILFQREMHSEKTLDELYDPDTMPVELKEAHHQLDLAVERCYRSKPFESDEERLEHLFNLYERMIAAEESNS